MEQVLIGGHYDLLDDTATEYISLYGQENWAAAITRKTQVISTPGVIKNLRVKLNDSPGAGKHYDFTLMVNGAPTALTLEIADAAISGNNMVNEIDVAPGDTIALQCNPDGTPTARYATWTSKFAGAVARESLILGHCLEPDKTVTHYTGVMGGGNNPDATENDHRMICPTSGTIKDFYVDIGNDPGDDPDAYRFTIRLNKVTVAQSLIVTIVADDTTGSDLVHELAVVAGDVLTMKIEPLNTPLQVVFPSYGMTFVADIDGESVMMAMNRVALDDTATEYSPLAGDDWLAAWSATEANQYQLGQECTLKKLHMLLSAAPGAGKSYTFTVRIAGGDSNVVVAIADAATTGDSGALEDTVADDDYVGLESTPAGTPATPDAYWGLVSYIEPPPYILENKSANMGSKMVAAGLI